MSKDLYKNLNVNDFDKFDCVKLSLWFYFSIAYLLRGYIVWILSIANRSDSTNFMTMVYPESFLFYLNLGTGLLGIFLFIIITLRRPDANSTLKTLWKKSKTFILIAIFFDFSINLTGYFLWDILAFNDLLIHSAIILMLIIHGVKNDRIKVNLIEFPMNLDKTK